MVDRATFQAELDALRVREKAHTREGRRDRRGPSPAPDGGGRLHHRADRPARSGHAAGRVRGPPAADRLLPHVVRRQARRRSSARAARSTTGRSASCPTCIPATSPTPRSARARTRRACATATSWAGTCPGTQPRSRSTRCSPGARSACFTWCATCGDGDRVFETYWTNGRGVEAMDNSYALLDLTVYGRQETWEDSPAGWPRAQASPTCARNGRPTAQWSRLEAGRSDDLGPAGS